MAPGAQLWFHPHLWVCFVHQSLLQRLLEHMSPSGRKRRGGDQGKQVTQVGGCWSSDWKAQALQAVIMGSGLPWWEGPGVGIVTQVGIRASM